MEEVAKVKGIERIRFTSPHPKDYPDRFLDVMAGNPKVCKSIHIPLQAGNNRVLGLMDRSYTKEEFLALAEKMKKRIPGVTLTTDIIVGFPTETDEEFADTIDVVQKVGFDVAFTFKYSERKGTIASKKYPDDVSEEKKTERIMKLIEIQRAITLKNNQAYIGQICDILIEPALGENVQQNVVGRTDGNHLVILPQGPYKIGDIIKACITEATPHVLKAVPVV